jgi:arylsulfatase
MVGAGRVEATVPLLFSADETADVGNDTGTPVTDDLAEGQAAFNGRIEWVQIDLDAAAEDVDHLITPEERYRVAMARQ